ncbi:MAG: hypothetical protein U1E60_08760 [Reyranellaceae bacterium]
MRHISQQARLNAGAPPIGTGLLSDWPTLAEPMGDLLMDEARP